MTLIQQVVQTVWPQDVVGWLTAIGILASVIAAILTGVMVLVRSFRNSLKHDIDGVGVRITKCEGKGTALQSRLDKVEFDVQRLTFESRETSKEVVSLREAIRETAKNLDHFRASSEKEVRKISDAVSKMEGSVEMFVKHVLSVNPK